MSEKLEFYGPTVAEALSKASATLGIAQDRLDFEILDQGSAGFLGIGAREARIVVKHQAPRSEERIEAMDEQPPKSSDEEGFLPIEEPLDAAQVMGGESTSSDVVPYELIVAVDKFMTTLIEEMGFDATVDAYDAGESIKVDVATKETGLFIGQKGETIDAIQYLLNVAVYKVHPFSKRIIVDSEGYRQRRVEAIQGMAHRTARRVMREKRSLSLPPMSASERRVVHLFLKENPNVTTFSDGEEEDRRVIVSPT
jgi:spoIIIJ-associated protein